jgi:transketolase
MHSCGALVAYLNSVIAAVTHDHLAGVGHDGHTTRPVEFTLARAFFPEFQRLFRFVLNMRRT